MKGISKIVKYEVINTQALAVKPGPKRDRLLTPGFYQTEEVSVRRQSAVFDDKLLVRDGFYECFQYQAWALELLKNESVRVP